jgi:hypothetical protein
MLLEVLEGLISLIRLILEVYIIIIIRAIKSGGEMGCMCSMQGSCESVY